MEWMEIVTWVIFGIALWIAAGAAFIFGWIAFNKATESASASPARPALRWAASPTTPSREPVSSGTAVSPAPPKSVFA